MNRRSDDNVIKTLIDPTSTVCTDWISDLFRGFIRLILGDKITASV